MAGRSKKILSRFDRWDRDYFEREHGIKSDVTLLRFFVKDGEYLRPDLSMRHKATENRFHAQIAARLCEVGVIDQEQVDLQYVLTSCPTLKTISRKALGDIGIITLGQAVKRFVGKEGFIACNKKGFGGAKNYYIAKRLHKEGYLTDKQFEEVPLPSGRHRTPSKEEIGEIGNRLICEFDYEFSKKAKYVMVHSANWGTRGRYSRGDWSWENLTLYRVIQRFVKIQNSENQDTFFWRTGHMCSHWYQWEWDREKVSECLPEIERFLVEQHFISLYPENLFEPST
jgi:hypothetical protein